MDLRPLSDIELERHLNAAPHDLQLILEAARRFPRAAELANETDGTNDALEEAESEIAGLKDDLAQAERQAKDLQDELDDAPTQEELDAANAEIARLNTVLGLIADA